MRHIKSVKPNKAYCLEIALDNGSSIILNLKDKLETIRFSDLKDHAFFCKAETDGICIRWGNTVEISLQEAFQLAQK